MMGVPLRASIILPVYNGARSLPDCLAALRRNQTAEIEILVVDDRSTDESSGIARRMGVRVIDNTHNPGPAGARNAGAEQAAAPIIFFVDADVLVPDGILTKALEVFERNPQIAALFGSYDQAPSESNFLSQYKNLLHHYVHQNSKEDARTFWAGFGAVRKEIFQEMGGFSEQYRYPSIEDIELGERMSRRNFAIRLDKSLQVKHMKHWRFWSLLQADIRHRAYPWSRLILQNRSLPNDLNLQTSQRISAVCTAGFCITILLLLLGAKSLAPWISVVLAATAALLLSTVLFLNRRLYRFFASSRGPLFMLGAIPWHLAYYIYSIITFAVCFLLYRVLPGGSGRQNIQNKAGMAVH
jgi:glycosyltransferase involved in cell wall biosynthesis